ncbi:MAG TPA: PPOX class F420-dependent oxidoreductase [Herpetosiphonaceae bacterium]|jgi:PPOX class probable F420-dependent enzyme|nr:PPOX class F420-dependent oxidoreductase [Herpetosiphonaceae bacterium]
MTQPGMTVATPIPASHQDLLDRPLIMALATTLSDGTPQVTPVWFNYEDGAIYFNTARGRLKDRAIRQTPYVAITIVDPDNMYRYLAIRGPVTMTEEGGRDHIDLLAKRYMGADKYPGPLSEVRIKFRLTPEHVLAAG